MKLKGSLGKITTSNYSRAVLQDRDLISIRKTRNILKGLGVNTRQDQIVYYLGNVSDTDHILCQDGVYLSSFTIIGGVGCHFFPKVKLK